MESGLLLVAGEVLRRLARSGLLEGSDAWEYLTNNIEGWRDLKQVEGEEPFESLLEKLDNAVLGLVESLDADSEELPRLIDEMLTGSLWARQIARRGEEERLSQLALLQGRSALIWNCTTSEERRGHFAMGVGLEAGLVIDDMADELAMLADEADEASLSGDLARLTDSLASMGERLLVVRAIFTRWWVCPPIGEDCLEVGSVGVPIREIGADKVAVIEDLFIYRLVWAVEAIRTRRLALGWRAGSVAGGGAGCVETGPAVPKDGDACSSWLALKGGG